MLVRFYTNSDGGAARRTTLVVLCLVGLFYLFPTLYGVLGRIYTPELLMTGRTDAVVVLLPGAALGGGILGQLLAALVAAGAFAAFLSSSSGLLTSVAGVISTDVIGRGSVRDFRLATVMAGVVPVVLALNIASLDVSQVVGLAFAVAASSFCPLLVLGIWWRGLTARGAAAGVLAGGGASAAAVLITVLGPPLHGWPATLVAPAGGVDGAARVRGDGGRVAGHPQAGAGRRRRDDAAPARPRIRAALEDVGDVDRDRERHLGGERLALRDDCHLGVVLAAVVLQHGQRLFSGSTIQ